MKYIVIILLTLLVVIIVCIKEGQNDGTFVKITSKGKTTYIDPNVKITSKGKTTYEKIDPNYNDVHQARKFLRSIPPECGKSNMSTLSDGTVKIQVICNGTNPVRGRIDIKDGVVTRID